eukprot:TRINITY_DN9134_c0_g1_i2.p1 TRINITY_DN9134_c0_g1~~TRINITY_DN9134_c0_g1_i2.p1  ORF type:complete len:365 (+),score=93.12 TRINITY_DN9134_c0_g1_i2:29-1096(+)
MLRRHRAAPEFLPLRPQDLALLCTACLVVFFSLQSSQDFAFELAWVYPVDQSLFENKHFPSEAEITPNVVVADLSGDGVNELIAASYDRRLLVLGPPTSPADLRPTLTAEASLESAVRLATGRHPVALAVGYLQPPSSSGTRPPKRRRPVIVVLTDGGTVLCFSAELKLLWETALPVYVPADLFFSEAAAVVSQDAVRRGDLGTVYVALRLQPKSRHAFRQPEHEHDDGDDDAGGDEIDGQQELRDASREGGCFALDGRTGAIRWRWQPGQHEDDAFDAEERAADEEAEEAAGHHSFQRHAVTAWRLEPQSWRRFQASVLGALPHFWAARTDTRLALHRFQARPLSLFTPAQGVV